MVSSVARDVKFGTPSSRSEKGRRAPGRTCDQATCTTVLSTYNPSPTCWLHTAPSVQHPLHRG
jgi:hypothetical protein